MHNQPNSPAISPLRQRLIDDMNLRHFGHETQRNYLRDIGRLASFLGSPPIPRPWMICAAFRYGSKARASRCRR